VSAKYEKQKLKHLVEKRSADKRSTSLIPPALLRVFDDYPATYFEDMDEDFYCQRKYNGVRCLAKYADGRVILYSRRLHEYNMPDISAKLLPILQKHKSIMLDGELYIHGEPLQYISGIVRGSDLPAKKEIKYIIFDLYDESKPNNTFAGRQTELKNLDLPFTIAPTYKLGKTRPIKSFLDKVATRYKDFLAEDYEGMVLRRDSAYEPGYHEKHTDAIFKHKPVRTKEYKIVDYTDGRGKDKNKIIWICETADHKKFSVRPKSPADERAELYKKFKNNSAEFNKYKGKPLTIEYNDLSVDGIPQQPRAIILRTYE
jgi:ATP-dependent DNA ligase